MGQIVPIQGQIQHYQWGGKHYIADLIGQAHKRAESEVEQPQAEYWLGEHTSAPAQLLDSRQSITDFLSKRACKLQFLLKILDVRNMLSIQVHPNLSQAKYGFEQENANNVNLTAPNRNYKDTNHKPELMVALSEFWLLHGFRTPANIAKALSKHEFLQPLAKTLATRGLADTFATILDDQNPFTGTLLKALLDHFSDLPTEQDKSQADYWIQRWLQQNPGITNGLLAIYFLNIVKVDSGDAIYQPAGMLHAYLEGQNIELMANSDNVLRAGLTPKHVDVAELLRISTLVPTQPEDYIASSAPKINGEICYQTPFTEFELSELNARRQGHYAWHSDQCEIIFCIKGQGSVKVKGQANKQMDCGDAFLIVPGTEVELNFFSDLGQVFKARNC